MLIPSYTSLFQNKTTELSCTYPSYPRLNSSAVKYELYARRALVLNCLKVVTGQACFVQSCFTMDLLAYRQLSLYSRDQALDISAHSKYCRIAEHNYDDSALISP